MSEIDYTILETKVPAKRSIILCKKCNSTLTKDSWSKHKKSIKHNSDGDKKPLTSNAEIVRRSRSRKREELGDEQYRKLQREKKAEYRRRNKKEKIVKEKNIKNIDCDEFIDNLPPNSLIGDRDKKITSLNSYIKDIERLHNKMYENSLFNCNNFEWLENYNIVIKFIEDYQLSNSWKLKMFVAIYSILTRTENYKELSMKYRVYEDKYNDIMNKERGKNQKSKKELKNWMDWDNIKNYNDDEWDEEDNFLHALITGLPPRRVLSYKLLKLTNKSIFKAKKLNKNFNYLIINKHKKPVYILYNRFKTSDIYPRFIINLRNEQNKRYFNIPNIYEKFKLLYNKNELKNADFVFSNIDKTMISNFTERLNKLYEKTDKKISSNILRHSYITDLMKKNLSDNSLHNIANYLSHSYRTLLSYRKIDDIDQDDIFIDDDSDEVIYLKNIMNM